MRKNSIGVEFEKEYFTRASVNRTNFVLEEGVEKKYYLQQSHYYRIIRNF